METKLERALENNDRMVIVNNMQLARAILSSNTFAVPNLYNFLTRLEECTEESFETTKLFINTSLFFLENEQHENLRKHAMVFFSNKNIARWDSFLLSHLTNMVDGIDIRQRVNLVDSIAVPIFKKIARPMLGLFPNEEESFDTKAMMLQQLVEPMQSLSRLKKFESDLAGLLHNLRNQSDKAFVVREHCNNDSFLEMMLKDGSMNEIECQAFAVSMFAAIAPLAQTAVNMLAHIYTINAGNAISEKCFLDNFEEYLWFATAPKYIHRIALQDEIIEGITFEQGKTILLDIHAVSAAFPKEHTCPNYVSFGAGKHLCVGASLSKRVLKILVPLFMKRFPKVRVGESKINDSNLIANEFNYFYMYPID